MAIRDESKAVVQVGEIDASQPLVKRDNSGRFVKGYSGNPAGKPKGVKHRATLIKEMIDASLADMLLEEFIPVMEQAIMLAKKGDRQMIKLLLNDLLAEVRKSSGEKERPGKYTQVIIENFTMEAPQERDDEHRSIEGEAVYTDE